MMIYGEFEAFARISECLGLLLNGSFIAMEFILLIFCLFSYESETWRFWFSFVGILLVGVVIFPSLPFMRVMLFPCFALGNASGEGGAPLVSFSPFFVLFFSSSLFLLLLILFHSLFLPFFFSSTSHSASSLSYAQTLSIPFFFFSSFPPLSFPSPSFFFFSSFLFISISFSFPLFFLMFSLFFF